MDLLKDERTVIAIAVATAAVIVGGLYLYSISGKPLRKVTLNPEIWKDLKLTEKIQASHNTLTLKFALDTPDSILGLPIGQHVSIRGVDPEGKEFTRPYTPTSLDSDVGYVELVIKLYPTGAMSQVMAKMEVGQTLPFRGPKGRFKYVPNMVRAFGMIGGGTGITPMYQVARAILENPADKTRICLISANVSEDDILIRNEMDALAATHPDQFKVYYVLNQPPEGWTGGVGYVTADIIKEQFPAPGADVMVLRCGPPAMNKAIASNYEALGYPKETQFQF